MDSNSKELFNTYLKFYNQWLIFEDNRSQLDNENRVINSFKEFSLLLLQGPF